MNQKQYLEQNLKGFEGDEALAQHFKDLIDKHEIKPILRVGVVLSGGLVIPIQCFKIVWIDSLPK